MVMKRTPYIPALLLLIVPGSRSWSDAKKTEAQPPMASSGQKNSHRDSIWSYRGGKAQGADRFKYAEPSGPVDFLAHTAFFAAGIALATVAPHQVAYNDENFVAFD